MTANTYNYKIDQKRIESSMFVDCYSEAIKILSKIPDFEEKCYKVFPITSSDPTPDAIICWFKHRFNKLGIYSKEDIKYCREEDARIIFCESCIPNLPIVQFRKLWRYLIDSFVDV